MSKATPKAATPKRKLSLSVVLEVPAGMSDTKAIELFNTILAIGKADAYESSRRPDVDNPDADLAVRLKIGKPKIYE